MNQNSSLMEPLWASAARITRSSLDVEGVMGEDDVIATPEKEGS